MSSTALLPRPPTTGGLPALHGRPTKASAYEPGDDDGLEPTDSIPLEVSRGSEVLSVYQAVGQRSVVGQLACQVMAHRMLLILATFLDGAYGDPKANRPDLAELSAVACRKAEKAMNDRCRRAAVGYRVVRLTPSSAKQHTIEIEYVTHAPTSRWVPDPSDGKPVAAHLLLSLCAPSTRPPRDGDRASAPSRGAKPARIPRQAKKKPQGL